MALKYLMRNYSKQVIGSKMLALRSKLPHIGRTRFKFLYRASENAYSATSFHRFCDNHGPTIFNKK